MSQNTCTRRDVKLFCDVTLGFLWYREPADTTVPVRTRVVLRTTHERLGVSTQMLVLRPPSLPVRSTRNP